MLAISGFFMLIVSRQIMSLATADPPGLSMRSTTVTTFGFSSALRKADENPKVVAVVLRIDSPGGSAVASDMIWRETISMKKPLIASMGDVAGSGGYYI